VNAQYAHGNVWSVAAWQAIRSELRGAESLSSPRRQGPAFPCHRSTRYPAWGEANLCNSKAQPLVAGLDGQAVLWN
jgi:hypothetical protein